MKKDLQDRLDGTYTRLLMRVQTISWREHKTKAQIYGDIPPISVTVAQRRARFAGHCYRAKDQVVSDIICWRLPCPNRGRRPFNYMDTIARSMNLDIEDIPKIMAERGEWRCRVNSISASAVTWWWICHFSDKTNILTFDLIFGGQDLVLRVLLFFWSPSSIILYILTPRSSIYHILLLRYNL